MKRECAFTIEQVLIHYEPEELERWKQGDPEVVPPEVLLWQGRGRQNGYGYAEHLVARMLKAQNHELILEDYNLFPVKTTKFSENNKLIEAVLGPEKYSLLQRALGLFSDAGIRIELPDICVLSPEFHFIEVKRDSDRLRAPQELFAAVVSSIFSIRFMIYKVLPVGNEWNTSPLQCKQMLPEAVLQLKDQVHKCV